MNISERVRQFIGYKDISLSKFNEEISAGKGYVEKVLQRNGRMGSDKLESMLLKFPELNADWLITGRGSMLRSDWGIEELGRTSESESVVYTSKCKICREKERLIQSLFEVIADKNKIISLLESTKSR